MRMILARASTPDLETLERIDCRPRFAFSWLR